MKRLKQLINKPGFYIFLFCLSVFLLNWPFLSAIAGTNQKTVFVYLFLVWAVIILILFLTRKSDTGSEGEDEDV